MMHLMDHYLKVIPDNFWESPVILQKSSSSPTGKKKINKAHPLKSKLYYGVYI